MCIRDSIINWERAEYSTTRHTPTPKGQHGCPNWNSVVPSSVPPLYSILELVSVFPPVMAPRRTDLQQPTIKIDNNQQRNNSTITLHLTFRTGETDDHDNLRGLSNSITCSMITFHPDNPGPQSKCCLLYTSRCV